MERHWSYLDGWNRMAKRISEGLGPKFALHAAFYYMGYNRRIIKRPTAYEQGMVDAALVAYGA